MMLVFVNHKPPYILWKNSPKGMLLLQSFLIMPKKKIVFALSMQQNPEPEHLHPVGVRFSSMTPVLFLHPWTTRTTIVQVIIWLKCQREVKSLGWAASLQIQWPMLPWCMDHHLPIKARILWTKRWDAMFNLGGTKWNDMLMCRNNWPNYIYQSCIASGTCLFILIV